MGMELGWYLVQVTGGGEKKASDALAAEGLTVWFPEYRAGAMHSRQLTIKDYPLFPGYLFARVDPSHGAFARIRKVKDVRLVHFGEDVRSASAVPERIIRDLTYACSAGEFDRLPKGAPASPSDFPQGKRVRFHHEAFGEIIGKIKENPHGQRALVFIEWLGKEMSASVRLDKLEAL